MSTKKFENVTAPSMNAVTFAPATVRIRKIENGISGSLARASITRKPRISAAATIRRVMTQPEPQPWIGALETAYTSRAMPAVTVTAPAMSGLVTRSSRLSRTYRGASRKAITPTGMLMKKIHSQPAYFVSTPEQHADSRS